jgi:hypothetical protein
MNLKPHCIQSSRVLVPAGTSKSTLHRHGIQAVTRVMAYVTNAVTLSSTMRTGGFELASSALTSSTLKRLHRIQCGFKKKFQLFLVTSPISNSPSSHNPAGVGLTASRPTWVTTSLRNCAPLPQAQFIGYHLGKAVT